MPRAPPKTKRFQPPCLTSISYFPYPTMHTAIHQIELGTPYKQESDQSERSIQAVKNEVAKRFPDFLSQCRPYTNVLTFGQWKARGYKVKKGERSIRIPILSEIEDKEEPKSKRLVRRTACLFAFPQVEAE